MAGAQAFSFRNCTTTYHALVHGGALSETTPPIQYGDVVLWQRKQLERPEIRNQLAYWKNKLKGPRADLNLPMAHPRSRFQTFAGARHPLVFSEKTTAAMKALARKENATLFMVMLSAFKALLFTYTHETDVIVGSTIANRNHPQLEKIIGVFINSLVMRTDLSGDPGFKTLLKRVRQTAIEAYDHQNMPFEKLLEALALERDTSRNPIFQILFILQNTPPAAITSSDATWTYEEVGNGTAKVDILLNLEERENRLEGWFEYNRDLFDANVMKGMAEDLKRVVARILENPDLPLSHIWISNSGLTDAEYHRQIVTWNDTDREFSEYLCVHHLFEAKADRTPDAIAVMHGEKGFSYRELNLRANRLAWKLQKMGVGPEMLVGICVERSVDMITGILGILKAGGAYVPLDPAYPLERIASMLKDSNVPIVLTQAHLKATLCEFSGQTIFLNDERETADDESLENPAHRTTGRNTAYVIYTSGSTGTPKGVMVLHQGVVNHALAVAERFNMASCDRVAQFFSISFDGAVEEIFMTLTQGAALVLLPFDPLPSMNVFMEWLEKDRVTVLDLPSAFWHEWMHWLTDSQKPLPMTLRAVIVGGEKASESAFNTWMKHAGGRIRWFNTYGPTETTVVSTIFEPDLQNTEKPPEVISIGRPIANTRIYVVDQNLQPVPVGMSGEMLIGGLGVARGYLNRDNLTAKKFIQDPFREDGRVYRTGDRVRYLPDGQIDFIGRFDSQVKIRGFRVEPGEVEAALRLCPAVGQAVVAVRSDRRGEKCLAAYVVPQKGAASDPSFFKQFLKQKLPSHLVPSDVVLLGSLPRLPNGKVDRRALPDPMAPTTMNGALVAPTTPLQKQLAEIWKSVLGISKVGIQDHFFELGGHSLLAVRLCSEIENQIGTRIPLQTLFQAPTIEKLSQEIESGKTPEDFQSLIEIQAGGEKQPLFFIHVLGAGLHFCRPLIKYLGGNQPVYGLSVHLLGGRLPTPNRVEDLAAHYVKEMRLIQPEGPYLLAGISFGGMVAYEMARQLLESGEKTAFLALLDTVGPGAVKSPSAGSRVSAHWESLMDEGPAYILNKLKWRLKRLQRSFQLVGFRIRRVYLDLYEKTGRPLNAGLRDFRARSYNKDAMERYVPRTYDGRMVLFRSHERILGVGVEVDPELGWGKLVKAGVEVFEAPSGHLGMLREPHVQFVGETIRACIDQALLKYL